MSRLEKTLLALNLIIWSTFAIFSYSFVDLNLTLSQNEFALNSISNLQQIAYYNRPLSATIYCLFLVTFFLLFGLQLFLFLKKKLSSKYLIISTSTTTFILVFSYPLLSYDLFNYMFDAKIIFHYHLSPYTHKPLDFPQDDWLRFMRWVHRYSPYGPMWLIMSLVPYALGFGKFVTTLFAFKIFIGLFHVFNTILIYKILQKINKQHLFFGTSFYALNPLFLIEGVANAHNDVVLLSFVLLSIYFFSKTNKVKSLFAIVVGVLVKYISVLLSPYIVASAFIKKLNSPQLFIYYSIVIMVIFTYVFSSFKITVPFVSSGATQVQFQPWYLFWILPLVPLTKSKILIFISFGFSVGALLRYLPFLYNGDWSHPGTTQFMTFATFIPILLTIGFYYIFKKWLDETS